MGLSNNNSNRTYITVRDGALHIGSGENAKAYDTISGFLESWTDFEKLVGKEGSKKPKHVLQITLTDGDDTYVVEAGLKSAFSKMFAGSISDIEIGDCIQIRVKANDREPASTSCFVSKQHESGGPFVKVHYSSFKGQEVEAWKAVLQKHPAYKPHAPKGAQVQPDTHPKTAFLETARALNWPDPEEYPDAYNAFLSRILKADITELEPSYDQWMFAASVAQRHRDPQAPIPKEFRDLIGKPAAAASPTAAAVAEYDPFEDE